jgi:hypothetical protein
MSQNRAAVHPCRTCERNRTWLTFPRPTSFPRTTARLGKDRSAEYWAQFLHQGAQLAGGRDCEANLAQMRFAIAVHRKLGSIIRSECRYKTKHAIFRCTMQTSD